MGRKKLHRTKDEIRKMCRIRQKRFYEKHKERIKRQNLKRYYEKGTQKLEN
jgi:hypothetical protein